MGIKMIVSDIDGTLIDHTENIFPELKAAAQGYVMSLTEGATPQDTKNIPFKQIQRPMYPIDEI